MQSTTRSLVRKKERKEILMEVRITEGYGESGLEILGNDSAFTSCLATEFISGAGSATASAFGSEVKTGAASAFCTVSLDVAASTAASAGAGSALPVAGNGNRAFPMS